MTPEREASPTPLTPEERADVTRLCKVLAQGVAPDDALAVTMLRLLPRLLAQVERLEAEREQFIADLNFARERQVFWEVEAAHYMRESAAMRGVAENVLQERRAAVQRELDMLAVAIDTLTAIHEKHEEPR